MNDLVFVIGTFLFFGLALGYALGCERLRERRVMPGLEYILGGAVAAALLIYLLYALLYPEQF